MLDFLKEILSKKEKSEELAAMWRNKVISATQEPGSTFKIVTATAEAKITKIGFK